nr:hypothetical protein Q903MT_gene2957 [Picea sitchensis]
MKHSRQGITLDPAYLPTPNELDLETTTGPGNYNLKQLIT